MGDNVSVANCCLFSISFAFCLSGCFRRGLCMFSVVPPTYSINFTNSTSTSPTVASTPLSSHLRPFLPAVLGCRVLSSQGESSCYGCEFNSDACLCVFLGAGLFFCIRCVRAMFFAVFNSELTAWDFISARLHAWSLPRIANARAGLQFLAYAFHLCMLQI